MQSFLFVCLFSFAFSLLFLGSVQILQILCFAFLFAPNKFSHPWWNVNSCRSEERICCTILNTEKLWRDSGRRSSFCRFSGRRGACTVGVFGDGGYVRWFDIHLKGRSKPTAERCFHLWALELLEIFFFWDALPSCQCRHEAFSL